MAIYAKTYTPDEQIESVGLNQISADANNAVDNIHPQYQQVLYVNSIFGYHYYTYNAAAGRNDISAAFIRNGLSDGANFTYSGVTPLLVRTTYYDSIFSLQFPMSLVLSSDKLVSVYFLYKNLIGAGFTLARSDIKFRSVIYEYDTTLALQSTVAQADASGASDNNWHEYHVQDIDLSALGANSICVVEFQTKMTTELTAAANDDIYGEIACARLDLGNR